MKKKNYLSFPWKKKLSLCFLTSFFFFFFFFSILGCSGIDALFSENGPFSVLSNGSVVLKDITWNSFANVVFLEQPTGVGFSYSSDPQYNYNTSLLNILFPKKKKKKKFPLTYFFFPFSSSLFPLSSSSLQMIPKPLVITLILSKDFCKPILNLLVVLLG